MIDDIFMECRKELSLIIEAGDLSPSSRIAAYASIAKSMSESQLDVMIAIEIVQTENVIMRGCLIELISMRHDSIKELYTHSPDGEYDKWIEYNSMLYHTEHFFKIWKAASNC